MSRSPYRDACLPQRLALAARRDRLEASVAALEAADELTDRERRQLREARCTLDRPLESPRDLDEKHDALALMADVVARPRAPKARWAVPAVVVAMGFALPFAPLSIDLWGRWRHWDSACARSTACERDGRCSRSAFAAWADDDRTACAATSDLACARSERCAQEGRCSAVDGGCEASSDDDCQASAACASGGRCRAVGGRCVRRP